MAKKKSKLKQLWLDFKKFISRGSVIDMAVGVVIGGAFSAIVNSVVKILMSVCTWAVPGGINGLITILPAANNLQAGFVDSAGNVVSGTQSFSTADLSDMVNKYAESLGQTVTPDSFVQYQSALLSKYTLYGDVYVYNGAAIIDWGTVINAIISFLIIALTLFIILKVYSSLKAARAQANAKILEEYYKKHPEERPVPPEPGKPEPKEIDYLKEIVASLKTITNPTPVSNETTEEKIAE